MDDFLFYTLRVGSVERRGVGEADFSAVLPSRLLEHSDTVLGW
jgi:hypothetical protein